MRGRGGGARVSRGWQPETVFQRRERGNWVSAEVRLMLQKKGALRVEGGSHERHEDSRARGCVALRGGLLVHVQEPSTCRGESEAGNGRTAAEAVRQ